MFRLILLAVFLLPMLALPAQAGGVALVLSESGGPYGEFAHDFEEGLKGSTWHVVSVTAGDEPLPAGTSADLIVTVGSEALRHTLGRGESPPVIATLLPRQGYEKIVGDSRRRSRITAIYLDQPPARQAVFLRHLLPGQKRFGMVFSAETRHQAGQYRQAFANAGLSLDTEDSDTDATLLPALNTLFGRGEAVVAQPDSAIYRRANIKAILITAFRHQRPVIGYSAAFANAGALAALYCTPSQIAQQAAEQIIASGTNLPHPSGPSQFAIAINHDVARALNLDIPDEASIRRALLADKEAR